MTIEDFNHRPLACPLEELSQRLGFAGKSPTPSAKPLTSFSMEEDDAPVFSHLYRQFRPRRHLEFGTWQGGGACLCLEACTATVWTINLSDGESKPDGSWAYGQRFEAGQVVPIWSETKNIGTTKTNEPIIHYRTDAQGFVGRYYRERGFGHRVCQIYCDSRQWDTSVYPPRFFDSALIDGGHQPEVVDNDTRKALELLRPGGLILWHDFCPRPEIRSQFASVRGVTTGIESMLHEITPQLAALHWINPSWILLGIKK